jgi:glycosyltransferase involved in cell wall biosynthesis
MKNKKKTVLFLTRLYRPHIGGVEKHVYEISKILSKKYQIIIITEQHDINLPEKETYPEAEIYHIPVSGTSEKLKKFVIWKWVWQHRQLFLSADIIHIHDVFFWCLPLRLIYSLKNLYITFHGHENATGPTATQKFWHQLAAKLTGGNICIGGFHSKWYGVTPTYTSFGAVNILPPTPIKSLNKAIFVGRLAEDTGIMPYLESLKYSKLPLDVYGDGPEMQRARSYVKENNLPVNFFGFVPEASNLISRYKIAFVSRYLGIIEGLAAGIPIVAHYNNAMKFDYLSIAPFSGFIKIAGTPREIAAAVSEISKIPSLMKEAVESGYNWAREQTWDQMCSLYLKLWQEPQSA